MRYTVQLTSGESYFLISCFFFLAWIVFWQIPKFRRQGEDGNAFASYRVIAKFVGKPFDKGGSFYRITLYDGFFVAVLFGCTRIRYADVKELALNENGVPSVSMKVNGVKIKLYSELGRLRSLHEDLNAKVASKVLASKSRMK